MNPYIIIGAILAFAAYTGAVYHKGVTDTEAVAIEHERDALIAYAERIKTSGEQYDKDQATIARLAADARRVRVTFPVCPSSTDTDGTGGALHSTVDDAFARLQARTGELVERCDRLNIDAIRSNGLAHQD